LLAAAVAVALTLALVPVVAAVPVACWRLTSICLLARTQFWLALVVPHLLRVTRQVSVRLLLLLVAVAVVKMLCPVARVVLVAAAVTVLLVVCL
jgi:hypothetical protein